MVLRRIFLAVSLFSLATQLHGQGLSACSVETVAGGGISLRGEGGPALEADILHIGDIAAGPDASIYVKGSCAPNVAKLLAALSSYFVSRNGPSLVRD